MGVAFSVYQGTIYKVPFFQLKCTQFGIVFSKAAGDRVVAPNLIWPRSGFDKAPILKALGEKADA
jgi:hypothetical protein